MRTRRYIGPGLIVATAAAVQTTLAADASHVAAFEAAQRRFDEARRLADRGSDDVEVRRRFHQAARAFAALTSGGVRSLYLYVNTANAYAFAGDPARGLLWYLRANSIANTGETRRGLATLRRVCGVEPWPEARGSIVRALMFWHYDLGRITKQRIFLVTFPVGCTLLLLTVFGARGKRVWLRVGLAAMLVGAAFGGSDLVEAVFPQPRPAVVLEASSGRSGNGDEYSVTVKTIRAGQEVRWIESRGDWVRVALPTAETCWVPARAVESV